MFGSLLPRHLEIVYEINRRFVKEVRIRFPGDEARVARIEARQAIQDLVVRYGMAVDDRDMDTVGALFTEDAVFRHGDDSIVNHAGGSDFARAVDRVGFSRFGRRGAH